MGNIVLVNNGTVKVKGLNIVLGNPDLFKSDKISKFEAVKKEIQKYLSAIELDNELEDIKKPLVKIDA